MKKPLPFLITLILVSLTLGCLMGCSTPVRAPRGSYYKMDGSMLELAQYKRVNIDAVVNQVQEPVDAVILEEIKNVSKSAFMNSGLFYEVNGLTGPFFNEIGPESKELEVIPSLVSLDADKGDSRVLMHYAFIDKSTGRELVWVQIIGHGGEVGVNGAIQGVGIGLSKMFAEEIVKKRNPLRHTQGGH